MGQKYMHKKIKLQIQKELKAFDKRHPLPKKPHPKKSKRMVAGLPEGEYEMAMWEITCDGIRYERNLLEASLNRVALTAIKLC